MPIQPETVARWAIGTRSGTARSQASLHRVHANLHQAPARDDLRDAMQPSQQAQRRRSGQRATKRPRPASAEPGDGQVGQRACQGVRRHGDDRAKPAHHGKVDNPMCTGNGLDLVGQQDTERAEVGHEQAQVGQRDGADPGGRDLGDWFGKRISGGGSRGRSAAASAGVTVFLEQARRRPGAVLSVRVSWPGFRPVSVVPERRAVPLSSSLNWLASRNCSSLWRNW